MKKKFRTNIAMLDNLTREVGVNDVSAILRAKNLYSNGVIHFKNMADLMQKLGWGHAKTKRIKKALEKYEIAEVKKDKIVFCSNKDLQYLFGGVDKKGRRKKSKSLKIEVDELDEKSIRKALAYEDLKLLQNRQKFAYETRHNTQHPKSIKQYNAAKKKAKEYLPDEGRESDRMSRGNFNIGIANLMERWNVSNGTVRNILSELEGGGLLKKERRYRALKKADKHSAKEELETEPNRFYQEGTIYMQLTNVYVLLCYSIQESVSNPFFQVDPFGLI